MSKAAYEAAKGVIKELRIGNDLLRDPLEADPRRQCVDRHSGAWADLKLCLVLGRQAAFHGRRLLKPILRLAVLEPVFLVSGADAF
jgi:hypothetical protein